LHRLLSFAAGAGLALAALSGPANAAGACPELGFAVVEPAPSPETRAVAFRGDATLQVRREPITRTADIVVAAIEEGPDSASLSLTFRPEAAERLERATSGRSGLRLAFVAGDEVLMAVTWEGPYGMGKDGARIDMRDRGRARRLVEALGACPGLVVRR
jgi:hypothetical protein